MFNEEYYQTIGIDFANRYYEFGSNLVELQIWKTTGDGRLKTIINHYSQFQKKYLSSYLIQSLNFI